jgi:hypothetical protein
MLGAAQYLAQRPWMKVTALFPDHFFGDDEKSKQAKALFQTLVSSKQMEVVLTLPDQPVLPLVMDTSNARVSSPTVPGLPVGFFLARRRGGPQWGWRGRPIAVDGVSPRPGSSTALGGGAGTRISPHRQIENRMGCASVVRAGARAGSMDLPFPGPSAGTVSVDGGAIGKSGI